MDGQEMIDKLTGGKPVANGRPRKPAGRSAPAPEPAPEPPPAAAVMDPIEPAPFPDDPDPKCFHGLAGQFVDFLDPQTEASRIGLLIQVLVAYGNVIGATPHFRVERTKHPLNLFAVCVGQTAKGRKGTSWNRVREPFSAVDPDWAKKKIVGGLSSGEGLIWEVRDPIVKRVIQHEKNCAPEVFDQLVDEGVKDKRVLVVEPEFASVLKQADRSGNVLSAVLRQAWESGDIRAMSKNSPATTTGAHVSIIGHVSAEELRRYLSSTEAASGFGNRFLWVAVRRSKLLPEGGFEQDLAPWVARFTQAVSFADAINCMPRDDEAKELWAEVYPRLSRDRPGLVGALTARAEAQTMRLACLYALLDGLYQVEKEQLEAALALWDYCERSAAFVFGDSTGNQVADLILSHLRKFPDGVSRTELSSFFSNNQTKENVEKAIQLLISSQLVIITKVGERGRPKEILSYAGTKKTK